MEKIRVLVVDDSIVVRRLVKDALSADPDITVIDTAVNGRAGVEKCAALDPDVVTMDIEMPELNGIEAVKAIRATRNRVPIIMFSTLTENGASATLDALAAGATDYVTKPANVGSIGESIRQVREQLIPLVRSLGRRRVGRVKSIPGQKPGLPPAPTPRAGVTAPPSARTSVMRPSSAAVAQRAAGTGVASKIVKGSGNGPFSVLAIGSSTGGPDALIKLLTPLPANLPVPVVITQHMPPVFTAQFAQRLDRAVKLNVCEASGGEALRPGHVYLAPGNFHMRLRKEGRDTVTVLDQGPQENHCRPAVDPMLRSLCEVYGGGILTVILTGMGEDGLLGCEEVVRRGGAVLAQDESTSVVWGMPGAVTNAGLPVQVLPLPELPNAVLRRLAGPRANQSVAATTGGAS